MRFLLAVFLIIQSVIINAQAESPCSQTITGEVRDQNTTDVLVGAEVVLSDKNGNVLETQMIKEDGLFSFTIKCETVYKLEGRKIDFTAESKTFTTTDEDNRVLKLIILLDDGEIDFVTDSKAKKAEEIEEVKTEDIKPEPLPDALPEEIEIPKPVEALPKPVEQSTEYKYTVKINPIYFDYESSWLNQKAKTQLQKVVDLMKQYPKMVIDCKAHTDAKGDVKYNQWMSDRRAQRVIDYIVSKGISSSRISGKGYEEKFIVNKCTNDVECTDEERAANRRVEFVIVKM